MNFFEKVFTDRMGNPSSKRMTGFIALLLFVYLILFGTMTGEKIPLEMWTTVTSIVLWVVGVSATEKNKNKSDS